MDETELERARGVIEGLLAASDRATIETVFGLARAQLVVELVTADPDLGRPIDRPPGVAPPEILRLILAAARAAGVSEVGVDPGIFVAAMDQGYRCAWPPREVEGGPPSLACQFIGPTERRRRAAAARAAKAAKAARRAPGRRARR